MIKAANPPQHAAMRLDQPPSKMELEDDQRDRDDDDDDDDDDDNDDDDPGLTAQSLVRPGTLDGERSPLGEGDAAAGAGGRGANRVRAGTWAGAGRAQGRRGSGGANAGAGRVRPQMDRSHSLVELRLSSERDGERGALARSSSFGSMSVLAHASFRGGAGDGSNGNDDGADDGDDGDDGADGDGDGDGDDESSACQSLPLLDSCQQRTPLTSHRKQPPPPRSAPEPSRRWPLRLSEEDRDSAAQTATSDVRLSPLRENFSTEAPRSAPDARNGWRDDGGDPDCDDDSAGRAEKDERMIAALRSRAGTWASADSAPVRKMNRRTHSMDDFPAADEDLRVPSLRIFSGDGDSGSGAEGNANDSADRSSASGDLGGLVAGTAGSISADVLDSPLEPSPSPLEPRPNQPVGSVSLEALPPYKATVPRPSRFPLPQWMKGVGSDGDGSDNDDAKEADADADGDADEDMEVVFVGEVGDQQRRPRSITFAAASAAPIMRMAARVRRSQSVESVEQGQPPRSAEVDTNGDDNDSGNPDFSFRRGPLPTVPGSPDSGTHGKHCDVEDDGDKIGSADDDESSDCFHRNDLQPRSGEDSEVYSGFEEPHELGFDDEGNTVRGDSSGPRSPTSSSDRAGESSGSSSGGPLGRWRRIRKRSQQQQQSCDQLYDDEGNLIERATPRAAPPPSRLSAPASDGWRLVASSPLPPTLGAPPESAPPALTSIEDASSARAAGMTSRRLGPAFDGAASSSSPSSAPASTVPASNAARPPAGSQQAHLAVIADEADSDNLADVATTAAMARAATGDSQRLDAGGEDVVDDRPMWKQLIDYFRYRPLKKKILTITVIASVVLVIIDFSTLELIRGWMEGFLHWMQRRPIGGFFAFIGLFITTTLVFIPPSILTFGSGFVFAKAFGIGPGVFAATLSSFFGASTGAVIAFFRARYMMRDLVKLFSRRYPIVKAADAAIKHKGFRIMVLLRLCPLIPFNALNYIGGITGVHWKQYTCALVGLLPFMITTVFLGATAGTVSNKKAGEDEVVNIVSISVGCGVSVLAVALIWYFARKELHREIAAHQDVEREEESRRTTVDELEESLHSRDVESSDFSIAASMGDSSADFGQRNMEDLNDEEWYWLWT